MQSIFGETKPRDPVRRALFEATLSDVAGPWQRVVMPKIGGLTAIGFDRTSEDMLVTSHNGQSVISGVSGEVLYSNPEEDGLDTSALKGTRLDHPAEERFDMAGMFGGALRTQTDDGWSVERFLTGSESLRDALQPDITHCLLHQSGASIHFNDPKWDAYNKDCSFHLLAREPNDIRAFGFSWTGRTLALATPADLMIWSRPAPFTL